MPNQRPVYIISYNDTMVNRTLSYRKWARKSLGFSQGLPGDEWPFRLALSVEE